MKNKHLETFISILLEYYNILSNYFRVKELKILPCFSLWSTEASWWYFPTRLRFRAILGLFSTRSRQFFSSFRQFFLKFFYKSSLIVFISWKNSKIHISVLYLSVSVSLTGPIGFCLTRALPRGVQKAPWTHLKKLFYHPGRSHL